MFTKSIQDIAESESKQRQVFVPYDICQDWTPWGRFGSTSKPPQRHSSSSSIRDPAFVANDKSKTDQSRESRHQQVATFTPQVPIHSKSIFDQRSPQNSNTRSSTEPQPLYSYIPSQSLLSRSNHLRSTIIPVGDKISSAYNINFSTTTTNKDMLCPSLMGCIQPDWYKNFLRRGYAIEQDGSIQEDVQDWKGVDVNRKTQDLSIAGLQGLAAGRLFVNGNLVVGASGQSPFECSGFCYESRFFVTTKHLEFEGGLRSRLIMQIPGQNSAYVADTSEVGKEKSYGTRKVHLLSYSYELDLAIFRLDPDEKNWDHFIKFSQLRPTSNFLKSQVWCVGYATRYDNRYNALLENYPQLLTREMWTRWKQDLEQKSLESKVLFRPNRRALYIGEIEDVIPIKNYDYHSIPSSFGLSGSMIGVVENGQAIIIGLVKGAALDELHNRMVSMTEQSSLWIQHIAEPPSINFIQETIPDGQIMPLNHSFTKEWTYQNTGTQAWPVGCGLVCIDGQVLSVVTRPVLKGELYTFSVPFRTPDVTGRSTVEVLLDWRTVESYALMSNGGMDEKTKARIGLLEALKKRTNAEIEVEEGMFTNILRKFKMEEIEVDEWDKVLSADAETGL